MNLARSFIILLCVLWCLASNAQTANKQVTLTGKLNRVISIGAETTGWALLLDVETPIDGKPMHSVQVKYKSEKKLEKLNDKHVTVVGVITYREGVETGSQPVLAASSIKATESPGSKSPAQTNSDSHP